MESDNIEYKDGFLSVSVLILTLNEEDNIRRCLSSLGWADDVVVLDSYSTDKTTDIVCESGAKLYQRAFDDYASQRNYGLNEIKYKNPWILMVDADEEVSEELVNEMKTTLDAAEEDVCLYRMRRKDYFMGRWIKRSSGYPTWFGRLIKVGHVKVDRAINEEYVTDGRVGYLDHHLHHYPFNKGFSAWLEKHNRYSSMEADLIIQGGLEEPRLADFLNRDPAIKRKAIKSLVYRMPGRPLLMFFALYVVRGGFLDGKPGLVFCLLRSFYEFMINCKVKEYQLRDEGKPL